MRILYLFSSAETSVAIVTLNQIKALKEFYPELEIKIACVNYYKENSVLEGEISYKKNYNSNQIINYIESLRFIKKVKQDFSPDITISNLGAVNSFNSLIGKYDIKIGIFHSPIIQFKKKNLLTRLLNYISLKKIYPNLNAIIGISQEVVDDLNKNIKGVDIRLNYNIHNAEDILKKSEYELINNLKQKNGTEIICLGAVDRNKRQDLIIKALTKLNNRTLRLYIVGKIIDKEYFEELNNLIQKSNLNQQIIFIPFLDNPFPLLKRVDMLISVSESEGLPGVVIESLLLNTPVICTNSSKGVWEILNVKEDYNPYLNKLFYTDKGIIIPNPNVVKDDICIDFLDQAMKAIEYSKDKMKNAKFVFAEYITNKSILSFYKLLEEKYNENNN